MWISIADCLISDHLCSVLLLNSRNRQKTWRCSSGSRQFQVIFLGSCSHGRKWLCIYYNESVSQFRSSCIPLPLFNTIYIYIFFSGVWIFSTDTHRLHHLRGASQLAPGMDSRPEGAQAEAGIFPHFSLTRCVYKMSRARFFWRVLLLEVQRSAIHKPVKSIEIHGFEGHEKPKPSEAPLEEGQVSFSQEWFTWQATSVNITQWYTMIYIMILWFCWTIWNKLKHTSIYI